MVYLRNVYAVVRLFIIVYTL